MNLKGGGYVQQRSTISLSPTEAGPASAGPASVGERLIVDRCSLAGIKVNTSPRSTLTPDRPWWNRPEINQPLTFDLWSG